MEKVSKSDLEKRSKQIFKLNSKYNELHATEDGNYFEKKGDARNHNNKVVKGEVHSFYRDGIAPVEEDNPTKPTKEKLADVTKTTAAPQNKAVVAPKAKTAATPKAKTAATPKAKTNAKAGGNK